MCLSVYLGTSRPLSIPASAPGQLGVEAAAWTPPPLKRSEFVYYLGRKSEGSDKLECSCLLSEYVNWTEGGPIVQQDDLYDPANCAFDALKTLCEQATRDGGKATVVCDGSGGVEQDCTEDDYSSALIRLASISRGNLLFADEISDYPWRALQVVR